MQNNHEHQWNKQRHFFSLQKARTFKDLNLKEGLTNKVKDNISQHLGFVLNCTAIFKGIWGLFPRVTKKLYTYHCLCKVRCLPSIKCSPPS